jgi:hypothetical protein
MGKIFVEISYGELIDKITILELKLKYFTDVIQLRNVNYELDQLNKIFKDSPYKTPKVLDLMEKLRLINYELWQLEKVVRRCANNCNFNSEFIDAARSIYSFNDNRHKIKKLINIETGSNIIEEKNYYV